MEDSNVPPLPEKPSNPNLDSNANEEDSLIEENGSEYYRVKFSTPGDLIVINYYTHIERECITLEDNVELCGMTARHNAEVIPAESISSFSVEVFYNFCNEIGYLLIDKSICFPCGLATLGVGTAIAHFFGKAYGVLKIDTEATDHFSLPMRKNHPIPYKSTVEISHLVKMVATNNAPTGMTMEDDNNAEY